MARKCTSTPNFVLLLHHFSRYPHILATYFNYERSACSFHGLCFRTAALPHRTALAPVKSFFMDLLVSRKCTRPLSQPNCHPFPPYPHTAAITLNYKRSTCSFCGLSVRTAALPHRTALAPVKSFFMDLLVSRKCTRPLSQPNCHPFPPYPHTAAITLNNKRSTCSFCDLSLRTATSPHQLQQ
jgi:hypothetical protein